MQFVYDVVCPFAWLASTQVARVAAAVGEPVEWSPILLGGLFREIGAPDRPAAARSAARVRVEADDLSRQAARLGVPVRPHPDHPVRTVEAMRLITGAPASVRPDLTHALFRAYHVENRDVSDRDVLGGIAAEHGVDVAVIDAPDTRAALRARTAAAAALGVFGVPTFVAAGRLWWGADRLPLVARALGRPRADVPGPGHRPVTFFHDFSSPFSYLAAARADRLSSHVEWVPILLGALFREIGTPDVPLDAMTAPRRAWMLQDLADHAEFHGTPFRFASTFPLRTVTALRVAIVEPRATPALYRAAWADDRDIGDPATLSAVLTAAGFDGPGLLDAAGSPSVKAALRANTERARAAGACGVPTFVVDGRLFWGQDRMDEVAAAAGLGGDTANLG